MKLHATLLIMAFLVSGCATKSNSSTQAIGQGVGTTTPKCMLNGVNNKSFKEIYDVCKPLSDRNDPDAQAAIASLYYAGSGIEKNYEKAFNLFHKSAQQGNAFSEYMVGVMYREGEYVEFNSEQYKLWTEKSAMQNYVPAQWNLALIYFKAKEHNEREYVYSYVWAKLASDSGHDQAFKLEKLLREKALTSEGLQQANVKIGELKSKFIANGNGQARY